MGLTRCYQTAVFLHFISVTVMMHVLVEDVDQELIQFERAWTKKYLYSKRCEVEKDKIDKEKENTLHDKIDNMLQG